MGTKPTAVDAAVRALVDKGEAAAASDLLEWWEGEAAPRADLYRALGANTELLRRVEPVLQATVREEARENAAREWLQGNWKAIVTTIAGALGTGGAVWWGTAP